MLLAAQERPYAGAQACRGCHPGEFRLQSASGHARSLSTAQGHPLAEKFTPRAPFTRKPNFRFEFSRQLTVRIHDEEAVVEVPIEWAFGAGEQAVTFVSRVNAEFYLEHYLSYYAALGTLAPTPGQDAIQPKSLAEAPGLLYKTLDQNTGILGCFECHSTGPVAVAAGNVLTPAEPGVHCEACHGPGGTHVKTGGKSAVQNPARMSAAELNSFCGRCHRPPAGDAARIDWNYAWNVRHQPVYLSQSRCFQKSKGALSCLSCHAAHEPLRTRDAAYYNQRCASCHTVAPGKPPNCVDCHMPRVAPQPPLRFTNHWIGVYGEGAKLKPR